jgi:hypothetical protein
VRLPLPAELAFPAEGEDLVLIRPSEDHAIRSSQALAEVADRVSSSTSSSGSGKLLEVVVSHVDHSGFLSPRVHLFNLLPIVEGKVKNPFYLVEPLRFVVMLNLSVSLQVQSLLSSLSQLITRQSHLVEMLATNRDVTSIDIESTAWDAAAQNEVVDVLRYGWLEAADQIARNAASVGFRLKVEYQRTAEPNREALAGRLSAVRRAYDKIDLVKTAVDKFVAALSTSMQLTSQSVVPDATIDTVREHFMLGHLRHCLAQALRDAVVAGNGFVAFTDAEPITTYNLLPDLAELVANDKATPQAGDDPVRVLHLKGLGQLGSDYGLSLLEPAIQQLQLVDMFADINAAAESLPPIARQQISTTISNTDNMQQRLLDGMSERLSTTYSPAVS